MSDLTTPLGLRTPDGGRKRRPLAKVAAVTVVGLAAAVVAWVAIYDDPLGGEPVAVARIGDDNPGADRDEVALVGVKSGPGRILRDDAPPADGADPVESVREPVASAAADAPTLTSMPTAPLTALQEDGPYGFLPRVGDDGVRPLDAYARPVPDFIGTSPRIAIVIGGLGLSQTGTQEALRQLPPEVTLAFAPYGSSLDRWTAKARQQGHELLLQIPMEPFDYPDNDPGPHTLLVTAEAEKNRDNLHWLLSRIGAYVGVMSYMGARFTSESEALQPLMQELAKRGLLYVDEGASPMSRAADSAAAARTPMAGADMVLDADGGEGEITARLAQLEQIARDRGTAVGIASALPVSVRTIAAWAATLERRGIALVPVSAAQGR
jgi:polysaccharide deacetylase 2 family uncharacterized protein YibQ